MKAEEWVEPFPTLRMISAIVDQIFQNSQGEKKSSILMSEYGSLKSKRKNLTSMSDKLDCHFRIVDRHL